MDRALILLFVIMVLAGLVFLFINEPAPAQSGSGSGDIYQRQAAARATATVAAAQEAGANTLVDAARQATAQAQAATVQAEQATHQARVDATVAAAAAVESTRQARVQEISLQATIEAGRAQATAQASATAQAQAATVQAQHVRATDAALAGATIAAAKAAATVESATATAEYLAPTRTVVAADTEAYLTATEWARRTIPWLQVGRAAFWTALGVLTILACVWVFPRAWIALQMRFLRIKEEGDGPEWMIVAAKGLVQAWTGAFSATPYSSDRDRGPGQTIDPHREPGLLPGGDPRVTERDQATQALTRPVQAAAAGDRRPPRRQVSPRPLAQIPGLDNNPGRAYRVIPPGATLPPPIRRALDGAVVAHLDNDWRSDNA